MSGLSYSDVSYIEHLYPRLLECLEADQVQNILRDTLTSVSITQATPTLSSLHTTVKHCRRCPSVTPEPELPHWNYSSPDMVLVNDTMFPPKDASDILIKALKETQWSSDKCAFTSLVRCPLPARGPLDEEIQNCSSYLDYELQIWKPKLIVPMGLKSSQFFFGDKTKLSEIKGTLFWLGAWPIFPTLSPMQLTIKSQASMYNEFIEHLSTAYNICYGS